VSEHSAYSIFSTALFVAHSQDASTHSQDASTHSQVPRGFTISRRQAEDIGGTGTGGTGTDAGGSCSKYLYSGTRYVDEKVIQMVVPTPDQAPADGETIYLSHHPRKVLWTATRNAAGDPRVVDLVHFFADDPHQLDQADFDGGTAGIWQHYHEALAT
jgi:hypothetical protein